MAAAARVRWQWQFLHQLHKQPHLQQRLWVRRYLYALQFVLML